MKLLSAIRKAERYFVAIGLLIMMIVMSVNVFNRFVLKQPIEWSDELVRYIFIWVIMIGTSIGVEEKAHVAITFFTDLLPKKINKIIRIISNILCLFFCIVLVVSGIILTISQHDQIAATLRISMSWLYASVPVGFTLTSIAFIENIIEILKEDDKDEEKEIIHSNKSEVSSSAY